MYKRQGTNDADIDMPEAWNVSEGADHDVIVAVIDDGVSYQHPDLMDNMWDGTNCKDESGNLLGNCIHGYDFTDEDKDPSPITDSIHGTHIAGTIGAKKNNGIGVAGVAPNVKIMALKFDLYVSSEIRAIDFAIQNGAKVINASFGSDIFSPSEYSAVNRFRSAGGLFVAAAGNASQSHNVVPIFPCDYDLDNIICVAATDINDNLSSFSDYGTDHVDVAAPGERILSTSEASGYIGMSGTSMATPHVAGLAALILGFKDISYSQVKSTILATGDSLVSLSGKTVSGKRINAYNALSSLATPSSAKAITAFSFPEGTGAITGTNIAVTVPFGTNLADLVATFTTTGSSVSIGATPQVSATTHNNFTNPVTYTVTAADASTQDYVVTVSGAATATLADLWSGTAHLGPAEQVVFSGIPAIYDESFAPGRLAIVEGSGGTLYAYFRQVIVSAGTLTFQINMAISSDNGKTLIVQPNTIIAPTEFAIAAYDPDVIKRSDGYYMVFEGAGGTSNCAFSSYIAFSADGITNWEIKGVPICATGWDKSASTPNFIEAANGDLYLQWVSVNGSTEITTHHQIKMDTADLYKRLTDDVTSGQLPQSSAGLWDEKNFGSGSAIYENGYQYLFFEGATKYGCTGKWGIGLARTNDIDNISAWTKNTQNPFLLAQKFDSCWMSYPDIKLINGKYYLYYGYWFPNWPDEKKSIFRKEILSGAPVLPIVSAFAIPASSSSLAVSITTFAATDDGDISGYRITESATPPLVDDIIWSVIPPTLYTFSSAGTKTLYAWVKDDAGHVSQGLSGIVTVAVSSEKAITAFTIPNQTGTTTINEGAHTISITMPTGTNVTALIPAITITGSSINPNTGVAQNFTSPVNYTVTAADASTQVYVVTVIVAEACRAIDSRIDLDMGIIVLDGISVVDKVDDDFKKAMEFFSLNSKFDIQYQNQIFESSVPHEIHDYGCPDGSPGCVMVMAWNLEEEVIAALPVSNFYFILWNAAPLKPWAAGGSLGIEYGIEKGGIKRAYSTAAVDPWWWSRNEADGFEYGSSHVIAHESLHMIDDFINQRYDCGIDLKGDTEIPSDIGQNYYDRMVKRLGWITDACYQKINSGGASAMCSSVAITAFSFPEGTGAITGTNIAVTVPFGTNPADLVATFTTTGSSVAVGATPQVSATTHNNFTSPVTYTVTAADASTQDYVVTVTIAPSSAKAITAFTIPNQTGTTTINEGMHTISITMPTGTNVTTLTPTITITGSSINPNTGVAQDFTNPVSYTVTAADTSTQEYVVTVIVTPALSSEKAITAFSFGDLTPSVIGAIDNDAGTVILTVPYGTNVTALIPAITITGALISPASGLAQDFTLPVTYTLTAQDNSTKAYLVTVNISSAISTPLISTIPDNEDYFKDLELSFDSKDVKDKKTSKKKVTLKFKNTDGIKYFKTSHNSHFEKAEWGKMEKEISLDIDQQKRDAQKFFFKFKDKNDDTSKTYEKKVTFNPDSYSIFNFPKRGHKGDIMIQSGDGFSPNSKVALYFSGFWGGYYAPVYVDTDEKGGFSLNYKINKVFGWYRWYAVDLNTKTESKTTSYLVY